MNLSNSEMIGKILLIASLLFYDILYAILYRVAE